MSLNSDELHQVIAEVNNFRGKQDYILARLYITKDYIQNNQKQEALDCINDIIDDIITDYGTKED